MHLDHFFILTAEVVTGAELLVEAGFTEGTENSHPGQGTANRRFFFSNTALELLYIVDRKQAEAGPSCRLRLSERIANPLASPFGIIVRRGPDSIKAPFPGWYYQPDYFEDGVRFLVGENSERLEEPLCICMPRNAPRGTRQSLPESPFLKVTELRLHVPVEKPSSVIRTVAEIDGVIFKRGSRHLMEVTFGHGRENRRLDLQPVLPLQIHW